MLLDSLNLLNYNVQNTVLEQMGWKKPQLRCEN
jgi:hypothetical protein